MSAQTLAGLNPWLPWPLNRFAWWTKPVRAERLAGLRIGLAAFLLLDIVSTYLPHVHDFFGRNSLGSPEAFGWYGQVPHWHWSILWGVEDSQVLRLAVLFWAGSALLLTIGLWTRISAVVTWVLSTSFASLNCSIDNAGDEIRGIVLFYLMLSPCGAAWSLDSWWQRFRGRREGPVNISPWPLRLLFVQMMWIYFSNGLFKLSGDRWRSGESLYYVLADLTLARWSYAQIPAPYLVTRILSWAVLIWEAGFPLWVALPWTRKAALFFGVAFHLGIALTMELGFFVPYTLALYLPLLPWERWADRLSKRQSALARGAPPLAVSR
jgi:hypothetical protein